MSMATAPMTLHEFLALPDNGMERELIRGELKEKPMTFRNKEHATIVMTLGYQLLLWRNAQSPVQGLVSGGEAGCLLHKNTVVGIDVAYFSQETLDAQSGDTTLLEGAPLLAIEVLSPSDKQQDIGEKVSLYLSAGTAMVWVVDPQFRIVTVHRPGAKPQPYNEDGIVTGEPVLPGLSIAVADIFKQ